MNFLLLCFIAIVLLFVIGLILTIYISNKKNTPSFYKGDNNKPKKQENKKTKDEEKEETLESLYIRAGIFTDEDKLYFNQRKIIVSICVIVFGFLVALKVKGMLALVLIVFTLYMTIKVPIIILKRRIKERDEEILYYLPIVIEQLVVGVSSALDIGPCINYVVEMAEKRGTHNPVTLLLKQVQLYVRFGASLDDALEDVGRQSCHTELKNSFLQLSQVSKHGGEITKQLQELGTSVTRQREVIIEGRIRQLEIKATGPVFLVFAGHMGMLVAFLFMGLVKNLKV